MNHKKYVVSILAVFFMVVGLLLIGLYVGFGSFLLKKYEKIRDEEQMCNKTHGATIGNIQGNIAWIILSNGDIINMELPKFNITIGEKVNLYRRCSYKNCFGRSLTYSNRRTKKYYWIPQQARKDCGADVFLIVMIFTVFLVCFIIAVVTVLSFIFYCCFLTLNMLIPKQKKYGVLNPIQNL